MIFAWDVIYALDLGMRFMCGGPGQDCRVRSLYYLVVPYSEDSIVQDCTNASKTCLKVRSETSPLPIHSQRISNTPGIIGPLEPGPSRITMAPVKLEAPPPAVATPAALCCNERLAGQILRPSAGAGRDWGAGSDKWKSHWKSHWDMDME